jgi:type VI secretion system protein ImpG
VADRDFLDYYNKELAYLRYTGQEFAEQHQGVASRLKLNEHECDDPHVARLLECFAFLAARIHLRLDDEFPEITGALLEELYPHLTRPVPPIGMIQFQVDPERGDLSQKRTVPRGTTLSAQLRGGMCYFQTCYATDIWPISVVNAAAKPGPNVPGSVTRGRRTSLAIELQFSTPEGLLLSALDPDRLRLHMTGSPQLVHALYQLLLSRCHTVAVCGSSPAGDLQTAYLGRSSITPAGFDADCDALCPNPASKHVGEPPQFAGFRVLEDYFVFPRKYHFLDLGGLGGIVPRFSGRAFSIWFALDPIEDANQQSALGEVSASTFRLGCTPVVNLFDATSGPIPVQHHVYETPIPVDPGMEIYSVNGLSGGGKVFQRLVGCTAPSAAQQPDGYFTLSRRDSHFPGRPPKYLVSIVSRKGQLLDPGVRALTATLTCTNRERLATANLGGANGDLKVRGFPELRIRFTAAPSAGSAAPPRRTYLWRLLSQLSLNHLSLIDGGSDALKALLRVHNLENDDAGNESIHGIARVDSSPAFARVDSDHGAAFVRGKDVRVVLDETRFHTGGMYLFGAVLDRFLGLYSSLNSFTRLSVHTVGGRLLNTWAPRSGSKIVA